jgi:hypothetical protein
MMFDINPKLSLSIDHHYSAQNKKMAHTNQTHYVPFKDGGCERISIQVIIPERAKRRRDKSKCMLVFQFVIGILVVVALAQAVCAVGRPYLRIVADLPEEVYWLNSEVAMFIQPSRGSTKLLQNSNFNEHDESSDAYSYQWEYYYYSNHIEDDYFFNDLDAEWINSFDSVVGDFEWSSSFDGNVRSEDDNDYRFQDDSDYDFEDKSKSDIMDSPSFVERLLEAAERGDVDAQVSITRLYEEGRGATQSDSMALRWYCEAALKGSAAAQSRIDGYRALILRSKEVEQWALEGLCLALIHYDGLRDLNDENGGVDENSSNVYGNYKDDEEASRWYLQEAFATMYEEGRG